MGSFENLKKYIELRSRMNMKRVPGVKSLKPCSLCGRFQFKKVAVPLYNCTCIVCHARLYFNKCTWCSLPTWIVCGNVCASWLAINFASVEDEVFVAHLAEIPQGGG